MPTMRSSPVEASTWPAPHGNHSGTSRAEVEIRAATVNDAGALAGVHRAAAIARYSDIFPVDVAPPSLAQLTAEWDDLVARAAAALLAVETGASAVSDRRPGG